MKQMNILDQQKVIGGKWQCEFCGKKTVFAITMSNHIINQHWIKKGKIDASRSYHWC